MWNIFQHIQHTSAGNVALRGNVKTAHHRVALPVPWWGSALCPSLRCRAVGSGEAGRSPRTPGRCEWRHHQSRPPLRSTVLKQKECKDVYRSVLVVCTIVQRTPVRNNNCSSMLLYSAISGQIQSLQLRSPTPCIQSGGGRRRRYLQCLVQQATQACTMPTSPSMPQTRSWNIILRVNSLHGP